MNKEKNPYYKLSEAKRALIIVTVFLIVANVLLGIILVRQSNGALKEHLDERLLDITNTAADMLDGDGFETITSRDESNENYVRAYEILKYFQDNIELEFIYCVRKMDDGTYIFTVDPAEEDCSEYGESVHITDALIAAYEGTPSVDAVPYEDA